MRLGRIGVLVATAAIVTLPALGGTAGERYGRHMMWDGGGWFMLFGPLMMLLFLAGFAVLVVLGVRWLQSSGHPPGSPPPAPGRAPLDILKERLARGEIEVAEYEERRRALGEG